MFIKEHSHPEPGSIPDLLGMFRCEVRFYREIAPEVGVRVPACYEASDRAAGFRLVLEDLSGWHEGGDPVTVARLLADLHQRWDGVAERRWPWLNRAGRAAEVIGDLYDRVWARIALRSDLTPPVMRFGSWLVGRVATFEREESSAPRRTLIHGDASLCNIRTSSDREIALLDWEDVRSAAGEVDLAWLLVSSVEPEQWEGVIEAYAPDYEAFITALPSAGAQGLLTLAGTEEDSASAAAWIRRLEAAARVVLA